MVQFDSPGRGLLMMFGTATTAFWNAFMDAGTILCSSWGSPLYFYTVRIILNMIFVPIIAGYILDTFIKKYELYEKHEKQMNDEEKEFKKAEKEAKEARVLIIRNSLINGETKSNGNSANIDTTTYNNSTDLDLERDTAVPSSTIGTAEEILNAWSQMKSSKQKSDKLSLRKHVINGVSHHVVLKNQSPMESRETIENELLGVTADKKERK